MSKIGGDRKVIGRGKLSVAIAFIAFVALTTHSTNASIYVSDADNAAAVTAGMNYQGLALTLQATLPNGNFEHVSATYLDPWDVATAAHNLKGATTSAVASTILIGTSSNYLNPSGGQLIQATSYTIFPSYVGGSSAGSTPDLAIVHLSSPLAAVPNASVTSTSRANGALEQFGGCGVSGVSGGTFTSDGNTRVWTETIDGLQSQEDYQEGGFSGRPGTGNAWNGDSGGVVFHTEGDDISIDGEIVYQDGGTGNFGGTGFINFAAPEIHQFILHNTTPDMPEPCAGMLLALGAGRLLLLRKRRPVQSDETRCL